LTVDSRNSFAPQLVSAPTEPGFHPRLFGNYFHNFSKGVSGKNLQWQLAGIASTALIISTGTDYRVERYFNQHPAYGHASRPMIFLGTFLPVVASGSLYLTAKLAKDNELLGASYAVIQSSLTTLLYVSLLKAITGRPHPDWQNHSDMKALSKQFRFGFMRGGIFWGWPSGHTASTVAVASALMNYYPHNTWLKIAGYGLMGYTAFGVTAFHRGGMHWFSDAVAALLMTYPIGATIGKYYRNQYDAAHKTSDATNQIRFSGLAYDGMGFSFGWSF